MAIHPSFPQSPYAELIPSQRWFPADEALRAPRTISFFLRSSRKSAKKSSRGVKADTLARPQPQSRCFGGGSRPNTLSKNPTDRSLHSATTSLSARRWRRLSGCTMFAERGTSWTSSRSDASGAVSAGMFDEDWPRYVVKMATGAGKTKVLSLLIAWSFFHRLYEKDSELVRETFSWIAPNIIVLDRLPPTSRAEDLLQRSNPAKPMASMATTGATTFS